MPADRNRRLATPGKPRETPVIAGTHSAKLDAQMPNSVLSHTKLPDMAK
jgi:hypothetical protein